jgi:hypothetical protein
MTLNARTEKRAADPRTCKGTTAELGQLCDEALIGLCLDRDQAAWREFVRRYEPALKKQVEIVVAEALSRVLDSDAIADVMGDFYVKILEADMSKLRYWYKSERKTAVIRWLTLLVSNVAVDHIRRAYGRAGLRLKAASQATKHRGAEWIATARIDSSTNPFRRLATASRPNKESDRCNRTKRPMTAAS